MYASVIVSSPPQLSQAGLVSHKIVACDANLERVGQHILAPAPQQVRLHHHKDTRPGPRLL